MAGTEPRTAQVYLLRCWREAGAHRPPDDGRRYSLEDPRSGERRGFATLAALVAALEGAISGDAGSAAGADVDRGPPA